MRSLRGKIFLALLLACLVVVLTTMGLYYFRINDAFRAYLTDQDKILLKQVGEELEQFYDQHGSWLGFENRRQWHQFLRRFQARQRQPNLGQDGIPPPRRLGPVARRLILLDVDKKPVQGRLRRSLPKQLNTLQDGNGQTIGHLGIYERQQLADSLASSRFVSSGRRSVVIVLLVALGISLFFGWLLSRQFVRPIKKLREGTAQLAQGNYSTRLNSESRDEIGVLSRDFNTLALRLEQNEAARKQWIMDTSHELRTPLSVLKGELEAIEDGLKPFDEKTAQSLKHEVSHLQSLVNDLHSLTSSDIQVVQYEFTDVDLGKILRESISSFATQFSKQKISLAESGLDKSSPIKADAQRLKQLFDNLLKNTLRYTDSPGRLEISLTTNKNGYQLCFADTAPGVLDGALTKLFERLYRGEKSRNRKTGGFGLGLSICQNIVAAHQGEIDAKHSKLGGLEINIYLPKKGLAI